MRQTRSGRYISRLTRGTMAVVMAGGRGARLADLTAKRSKPATPFGGKFRIIDFTLSNCVNSGIRQILLLTQYKSHSLIQHIQRGWGFLRGELGEYLELVPAQQKLGDVWYRGTADALYQNLDIIEETAPETVLVLAGDHVYKMDYGPMISFHVERKADITVAVVQVPIQGASDFGIMTIDGQDRVVKFDEKPEKPQPMPGRTEVALASMGIYIFGLDFLRERLSEDAADESSAHDFGRNIIPSAIDRYKVYAYPFQDVATQAQAYWRDVGTVDAFYETNLELVDVSPELNLYDGDWPIWTYQEQVPSAKFVLDEAGRRGTAVSSMIAGGSIVSGATIRESILSYNVIVEERSEIERAVILPGVTIGKRCRIRRAIIDENCVIRDDTVIGEDIGDDRRRFHVTENGVVLVTTDMLDRLHDREESTLST